MRRRRGGTPGEPADGWVVPDWLSCFDPDDWPDATPSEAGLEMLGPAGALRMAQHQARGEAAEKWCAERGLESDCYALMFPHSARHSRRRLRGHYANRKDGLPGEYRSYSDTLHRGKMSTTTGHER